MLKSAAVLILTVTAWSAPTSGAGAGPATPRCDGVPATIVGTDGDDVITGTDGDDVIVGLDGDDSIVGGLGADRICGGAGDDSVQGHGDTDRLFGGPGADFVDGGVGGCCDPAANTGDDVISGGAGDDNLHSADFSGAGSTIRGRRGADQIFLYSGGQAYGNLGADTLAQYAGDATLDGGLGPDTLGNGGDPGDDDVTLLGGEGRDGLTSDDHSGTTTMDGGPQRDTCTGGTTVVDCEA